MTARSREETAVGKIKKRRPLPSLSEIARQLELYQGQRAKHREVVDGAEARATYLEDEVQKRLDAITVLRAELSDLPVKVTQSKAVIARLDDQIATLKAMRARIIARDSKRRQLARIKEKISNAEADLRGFPRA